MNTHAPAHHSGEEYDGGLSPSGWELQEFAQILWRYKLLVVLCILLCLGVAMSYIVLAPEIYAATTVVQVEQQQRAVVSVHDAELEDLKSGDVLKTIESNLASGALLLRVIRANKLDSYPAFLEPFDGKTPSEAALIRAFASRVSVSLRRGTRLIDVTVEDENPARARQLSESMVAEYNKLNFELKVESARPANQYLVQEAERLREKLAKSELALQAYKEEQHAVSLEASQNIVVEALKDLNLKLGAARAERLALESQVAQIDRSGNDVRQLLATAGIAASTEVQALQQRAAAQATLIAGMSERYMAGHPKRVQAEGEKAELDTSLERAVLSAAGQVKASFAAAKATEEKLLEALKMQEKQALDLNKKSIQYGVLSRDVESDRVLYDAVLNKLKQTQLLDGIEQGVVRVVEPAREPDRPARPKKRMALALALFIGLTTGVGSAFGLAMLRDPLTDVEHAGRRLALRPLGAIPKAPKLPGGNGLLVLSQPRSQSAEAMRSLRAALLMRVREAGRKSFLFTSAIPGEGKTFCAVNFAAALAQEGLRTLLVDADLRAPGATIHFLGNERPAGLADVLQNKLKLKPLVVDTKVPNLFFLPSGTPTSLPSELLARSAISDMIQTALQQYDCVVVDSAPVLAVSDTLGIVEHVQAVCLVVSASSTPGRLARRARQLLASYAPKAVAGFVLNRVARGRDSYYCYG